MTWSRQVPRAARLWEFLGNFTEGKHSDPPGEPTPSYWLGEGSPCDGVDPNPAMASCGEMRDAVAAGTIECASDVDIAVDADSTVVVLWHFAPYHGAPETSTHAVVEMLFTGFVISTHDGQEWDFLRDVDGNYTEANGLARVTSTTNNE